MCLIALAWHAVPGIRLLVAANRDEYHTRPTAAVGFWPDAPGVLAGRDLQDGGTWMGVTRSGHFAALTNHRTATGARSGMRSRGHLVADFLSGAGDAASYCAMVAADSTAYNGFNLLAGDAAQLWYTGDHSREPQRLAPGFHNLSNARLNTPWPKAAGLSSDMRRVIDRSGGEEDIVAALLGALADTDIPHDASLPDTGVGMERERMLAPRMIVAPVYGTRSGSVLMIRDDGSVRFDERSYDADGRIKGEVSESIPARAR